MARSRSLSSAILMTVAMGVASWAANESLSSSTRGAGPSPLARRPVALAGTEAETLVFSTSVLVPAGLVHEHLGAAADPREFHRYALVILADRSLQTDGKTPRSWSAEEIEAVDEYVRGGGCLLLTGQVPFDLCGKRDISALAFLGAGGWGPPPSDAQVRVLTRDAPYTKSLDKETYTWANAPHVLLDLKSGTPLVGGGEARGAFAGIHVNDYGKGKVFYVGMNTAEVARFAKDGEAYLTLLRNMAAAAAPLTVMEKKTELSRRFQTDVVVWEESQREDLGDGFATANWVPSLDFLFPLPGAKLDAIRLDLARDEKERFPVLVTTMKDARITIALSGDPVFEATQLFRRSADYHKLLPFKGRVQADKLVTCEFWLKFSSVGVAPGEYKGALNVSNESGQTYTVPIAMKVWNVALPDKPLLRFSPYSGAVGFINSLTGDPNADGAKLPQFDAYFADMKEAGFHGMEVYLHPYTFYVPVRINGEPFLTALKNNPDLLTRETLPKIDFSYYDPYFAIPRKYGMTEYIMLMGPANILRPIGSFAELLNREIREDSPEYERYALWLAREFREYLEAQGAKHLLAKHMDEISPEKLNEYKRVASLLQKAGWKAYCTWTGKIPQTPELIRQVNPNSDQWQIQLLSLDIFRTIVGREPDLIDRTDEIWFYGGGSNTYRYSYAAARAYGWYAGYYNVEGMGWWAYRMWHSRGEGVVFYDDGVVYTTPAREGLADALDDAQLYLMLNRKAYPDRDKREWDPEMYSFGLVGHDKGILPLTLKKYRDLWDYRAFGAVSLDDIRRARAQLLSLLEK